MKGPAKNKKPITPLQIQTKGGYLAKVKKRILFKLVYRGHKMQKAIVQPRSSANQTNAQETRQTASSVDLRLLKKVELISQ